MKKKIIFSIIILILTVQYLNSIEITILFRDGTSKTEYYDEDIEKLTFTLNRGRNVQKITGLEQFNNLNELWFGMTSQIENYTFLTLLKKIETLVLQDLTINNIEFIYAMPALRRLILQSCKINKKIDASKILLLEYFEFTNSSLTEFPIKISKKGNISMINIAFNNISNIPIYKCTDISIIAINNPIQNKNNRNIILGDENNYYAILPEKYRQYVR